MKRSAALALAASLAACHFASDPIPTDTSTMVGQWRSTDHLVTTDMTLARPASGADAVDGTATFRNYYGVGKDQGFSVAGTNNGLTWTSISDPPIATFAFNDNTHLSGNPTFAVSFRDIDHMVLLSDTALQFEFLRQ